MEETAQHRGYYAIIPATVRYDKNITPNAKLLYGEITALCNEKGYCWASNNYFATLYGVSKTSISNWISSLQKNNYLEIEMIYKKDSKEIQSRHIKINSTPMKENFNTPPRNFNDPMKENFKDNSKVNNKKEYTSKEVPSQPIIGITSKKTKKAKDIVTMHGMINAFTENETIKKKLKEYFNIRLKKGLLPNQWKIILDDLRQYANDNAFIAVEKINGAIAGGYMQIIASWEKDKKNNFSKPKFDNTSGRNTKAAINMDKEEKKEFEENLATDESGNLLQF